MTIRGLRNTYARGHVAQLHDTLIVFYFSGDMIGMYGAKSISVDLQKLRQLPLGMSEDVIDDSRSLDKFGITPSDSHLPEKHSLLTCERKLLILTGTTLEILINRLSDDGPTKSDSINL